MKPNRIHLGLTGAAFLGLCGCSPVSAPDTAGTAPAPDAAARPQSVPVGIVDEPLGARYSLGMTLWHLGHQVDAIRAFHDFVRRQRLAPEKLLPPEALQPPEALRAILVEPEGLAEEACNGWRPADGHLASGAGDQGPTVSIPLHVERPGLYRFWVGYQAWTNGLGVTSLRIYRADQEHLGPLVQPDEFYDQRPATNGPAWHDLLVDLPAGDLVVKLGHVTRWWHGKGSYLRRRVDCFFLTERLWDAPPSAEVRQLWRDRAAPAGIQWNLRLPLEAADHETWRWWQLRPVAWEEAERQPRLFDVSRRFWDEKIEELAQHEYDEAAKPDYRAPERQVVFNDTWNLVANPVRAQHQIQELMADVSHEPPRHLTIWHDVGSAIDGLLADGTAGTNAPPAAHGSWRAKPGELSAGYGSVLGTVATRIQVPRPGTYHLWVRSSRVNLSYTAPWFGRVSVGGAEAFTYHHEGKISNIWTRMGAVTLPRAGDVQVDFTLDGAGRGGTYRRIHTLLLTDDPGHVPQGAIRPRWTREQAAERARAAGAKEGDSLLAWVFRDPYVPLSLDIWADAATRGRSWPDEPVPASGPSTSLEMARESHRAVQLGLRNLTDQPLPLSVAIEPLRGTAGTFPGAVNWRVIAFVPDGQEAQTRTSRENWHPFFLLRRPGVTVPPFNVAGLWVTVDTRRVPAGDYTSRIVLREASGREHAVPIRIRVSPVAPAPRQPVLVDGFTNPHEGDVYLQDFLDHGMNVWHGLMSKAEMQRRGIRLLRLGYASTNGIPAWYANIQALGLARDDYFVGIKDEPGGTTEEALRPYIDVARALRQHAPGARISFNPSEGAELATFEVLAPWCDFWIPYSKHVFAPHWGNPKKWAIFHPKPWMWYTTPCLYDKTARQPGIRTVPSQPGNCVGVAFFALNYPWRDQWDTGYEHISDASTMGAVPSRHGPVATIVWEHIREAKQEADLAMMVREALGARLFDDVGDPAMQVLIRSGTTEELLAWLEQHDSMER
ncbi:MAG: hypothetical protein GX590_00200 [Lentisphaerae bacterium]|nr:hypothetical protein [Lentisphaerota bacterium]